MDKNILKSLKNEGLTENTNIKEIPQEFIDGNVITGGAAKKPFSRHEKYQEGTFYRDITSPFPKPKKEIEA